MYRDFRVEAFIPAGRERTLKVLSKHLIRFSDILDRVQLWRNTEDTLDLAYLDELAKNPLFEVIPFPKDNKWHGPSTDGLPIQLNTGKWYPNTTDEKTIYIRFDDDIVYIDDQYFKNILDFRIDNPEYFLVFGNILNNSVISHYYQKEGVIGMEDGVIEKYCMDMNSWGNPFHAERLHNMLLNKVKEGKTSDLFIGNYDLDIGDRFSISNFCYFGKDFAKFGGILDQEDEEIWLTGTYPKRNNLKNAICGSALVSHLTFSPYQKSYILEDTTISQQYEELAKELMSRDYYKLLNKKI